mgnify:FL=1
MKQERWKSILKPLTILPVIVMLCTIFGFSNQNGTTSGGLSQKVSRQIVTVCDTLFHQDLAEETIEHYTEKIEYPLRKAAHATEYLILTLLAALPLYTYGLRGKNCFWLYFYSVSSPHPGTNSTSPLFPAGLPRLQMYL